MRGYTPNPTWVDEDPVTHVSPTPVGAAQLTHMEIDGVKRAHDRLDALRFDVRDFGAVGDGVFDDTNAVQAALDAANAAGGGIVRLPNGTYLVSTLTFYANLAIRGESYHATVIKQKANTTGDLLVSKDFATLTLTGSLSGGIGGFTLDNFCLDGNKANQTAPNRCLAIYGYDFTVTDVHVRNAKGEGVYSEWGDFGGPSLPDKSMEARWRGLKVHDCDGWGWHNRGPHDSTADGVILWSNKGGNYWGESIPTSTILAVGSNGLALPQDTINVNSTVGYNATGGTLKVTTSAGVQIVTYTGITATSFTGCSGGTGTMSTGGAVTSNGAYSSSGMLFTNSHVWGAEGPYGFLIDGGAHKFANCASEGASVALLCNRANDTVWIGGAIFYGAGANAGCGLQVGDANFPVAGMKVITKFGGFQGASAATAAINLANDYGNNDIEASIYQPTGSAYFGTVTNNGTRLRIHSSGASRSANAANSRNQWAGATKIDGSGASAFTVNDTTNDLLNVNASNKRVEIPGGTVLRFYASGYSTPTLDVDGPSGHILPKGTAPTVAGVGGTGNVAAGMAVVGGSTDTSGEITWTSGTAPVTGNVATLTYNTAWAAAPRVVVTPTNAATASAGVYVASVAAGSVTFGLVNAPAAGVALKFTYHALG